MVVIKYFQIKNVKCLNWYAGFETKVTEALVKISNMLLPYTLTKYWPCARKATRQALNTIDQVLREQRVYLIPGLPCLLFYI